MQLIYEWSSYRLCVIVIVPLLLSFVLGLWYMLKTGDVVTAWTIALYIVTAAAGKLSGMVFGVRVLTLLSSCCFDDHHWGLERHLKALDDTRKYTGFLVLEFNVIVNIKFIYIPPPNISH